MIPKRSDCRLMECTIVLHGGACHRTSTPHTIGNTIKKWTYDRWVQLCVNTSQIDTHLSILSEHPGHFREPESLARCQSSRSWRRAGVIRPLARCRCVGTDATAAWRWSSSMAPAGRGRRKREPVVHVASRSETTLKSEILHRYNRPPILLDLTRSSPGGEIFLSSIQI